MAEVFMDDGQVKLIHGHVMDALKLIPDESVQTTICSPPYWALRSYSTEPQVWGGDSEHVHVWDEVATKATTGGVGASGIWAGRPVEQQIGNVARAIVPQRVQASCPCGAWRGELGHEPTPQLFVQHLVEVFREVRRVLKPDGVLFVNLGDSYNGSGKGGNGGPASILKKQPIERQGFENVMTDAPGIKAKSLVLIPERFVLAMSDDGWYARSRIAWCKKAPMPESVRDRPTNAWEPIYMFTRSARYFWDAEAVREEHAESTLRIHSSPTVNQRGLGAHWKTEQVGNGHDGLMNGPGRLNANGRNMWSYWLLSPDPSPEAHFATFPKELPRRCIAAATSERGECPKCGKPWVRVVETLGRVAGTESKRTRGDAVRNPAARLDVQPERNGRYITEHRGWAPQCTHDLPPIPQTVLDPFVGSGTTTMVARSMQRRSIGIDLSEDYLKNIALKKNNQMALMPAAPETEAV